MKVLKFGGTSVGTSESIKNLKEIVLKADSQTIVVVSAVCGVTDKLISVAKLAEKGDESCFTELDNIISTHKDIVSELFGDKSDEVLQLIDPEIEKLKVVVHGLYLIKELGNRSFDTIMGMGERLSSKIVAKYIGADWYDSRDFIKTNFEFGKNQVQIEKTKTLLAPLKSKLGKISMFPGFISSNDNDENTTLGRGGSDYTAALLASTFDASELQIWTDVDGFMTADPKIISRAYSIDRLSYAEAMELSHFGAKVIYPPTILPVYKNNIPIRIKNTFKPEAEGTLINGEKCVDDKRLIKGISSIKNVSLLTLHGIGMVGVTGISMRLFTALASEEINVILISQASSENSISVVIETSQAELSKELLTKEFAREIELRHINNISIENDMSVVAIVGEGMQRTTGISGKLFKGLGKNGINVFTIAQGGSEINISIVIKEKDIRKAMNSIHEAFFLSDYSRLNLFLVGKGTVGGKLLQLIADQSDKLQKENKLRIRLVGVAGSRNMILDREGLDPNSVIEDIDTKGENGTIEDFKQKMIDMNVANSVFVDCTASEEVASIYQSVLEANISVVTANKIASSSSYESYSKLKKTARDKGVKFFFETNVGAGLPIIAPINDLVRSGDKIIRLEAVVSGTLNFIANELAAGGILSEVIQDAKDKGFSEPDPRIDLSGTDVVRKLLILGRESGYVLEEEDVVVEPFVDQKYLDAPSLDDFMNQVKELDEQYKEQSEKLSAENKRLRYVARLEDGKAKVGLMEVDNTHPFYDLEGSNNMVLIWTANYFEHPMQIKGYGAGAEVTAGGVFADVIKVANV